MLKTKNKKLYFSLFSSAVLVAVVILAWPSVSSSQLQPIAGQNRSQKSASDKAAVKFDKNAYPTDKASSLWVVVNKGRLLPGDYAPAGLMVPDVPLRTRPSDPEMSVRSDAAAAMEKMFAAAKADAINLMLDSGYRSYTEQVSLYTRYVSQSGTAQADTFSARAGHSEHQTGLAADLEPVSRDCELNQCFSATPEGTWLAANCYKYGFIIRYQKDTQQLTGYEYEPWHVRFVGVGLALQLHATGQTLEQFFGLQTYTNYPLASYEIKD